MREERQLYAAVLLGPSTRLNVAGNSDRIGWHVGHYAKVCGQYSHAQGVGCGHTSATPCCSARLQTTRASICKSKLGTSRINEGGSGMAVANVS